MGAENNQGGRRPTEAELLTQIAELRKQLEHSESEKTQAQQLATAMAEASAFGGSAEEQPTGKTIKQHVCVNPWVKKESAQKWVDVDVPTYYYHIELPEGAGLALTTNGFDYFHGQTYELDLATLQDLKSRVARTWDHERSIHSENANAYRKPTNTHLKSKAAIAAGY